jgi:glycerol-3-phosphate acyltransferase PlsY
MRLLLGGTDLRKAGSGNVGATNALRTRGAPFAIGVLVIDVGKGIVAALALPALAWPWIAGPPVPHVWIGFLCGIAVALGHCYPVMQKFRGGKGVATLTGVFGALLPASMPWLIAAFVLTLVLSGYVSLASLTGALVAVLFVASFGTGLLSPAGYFSMAMLLLLVYKHRENIVRLLHGRENRFEKVMLLRRRTKAA